MRSSSACALLALAIPLASGEATAQTAQPPRLVTTAVPPSLAGGGEAALVLDVDARGAVTAVEVGSASSEQAALLARRWAFGLRFVPASRAGRSIAARVRYRVVFPEAAVRERPAPEPAPARSLPPVVDPEGGYESVTRAQGVSDEPTTRGLSRREASSVPGSLGDPLRALQSFPGVARPGVTAGDLIVRGASPWDTGVLVDGHPVPQLYHFLQGPAILNPAFLDRVELHPGGWGVQNGRKMAGLVEAWSRRPDPQRPHLEVEIDAIDGAVYASTPTSAGGTFAAAVRRSILGDFVDDLTGETATPIYYDMQARYDLRAGELGDLSIFFFGSDDQLVFPVPEGVETLTGPGGESFENETLLTRTIVTLRRTEGPFSLTISPAFGWDHIVVQTGADGLDYRLLTLRGRADLEARLSRRFTLRSGLDVEHQSFDFRYELPGIDPFIGEFPTPRTDPYTIQNAGRDDISLAGGYLELSAKAAPLQATMGIRADHYQFPEGNDRQTLEPRLSAAVAAAPWLRLEVATGVYHQAPLPRDLSGDFGNPDLDLERTVQVVGGAEVRIGDTSLEVELYQNRLTNGVMGSGGIVERDGVPTWENLTNGQTGTTHGIEVLLRRARRHRVSGWISYSLSRAERAYPGGEPELYAYDQTHILHAVVSVDLGASFRLSAQWSWVTGNPITPVVGATFDVDTDRYRADYGTWGDARIPAFHQLDVRLEKDFALLGGRARAYLEVLNAYNRQNPELLLYSYNYEDRGYFTGLPIVGTLGLGASF